MLSSHTLPSEAGPQIPVAVGIVIGLLSSLIQSLGLTIQRKSHILNDQREEHLRKVEHKRPLWLLGFAVFITSNIFGTVFQVGALPIVVLAPLGAVSLLWNALFARFLLGDVFTRYMVLGTVLITGGAILIAIFGVVPEPTHRLEDLVRLFGRTEWVVFSSVLGAIVLVVLAISHITEHFLHKDRAIQLPLSADCSPPSSPSSKPVPLPSPFPLQRTRLARTKLFLALAFAAVSGTLSGLCLLFAKSGVELLILTVTGYGNQFGNWTVVWGGGGLIVLAIAQLYYLNHSLRLSSPTLICPLAFSFYNLSSVFGGLVYFDQFALLTRLQLGLMCLGIAILLAGVAAVSLVDDEGGGVDVGVWVEEEEMLGAYEDERDFDEERTSFFHPGVDDDFEADANIAVLVEEPSSVLSPVSSSPPAPPASTSSPPRRRSLPALQLLRNHFTSSPLTASSSSPTSPTAHRPSRRSSSSNRYLSFLPPSISSCTSGTLPSPLSPDQHRLINNDDDVPSPTHAIFSIGLGAASPGFALRPTGRQGFGSGHLGHARRGSRDHSSLTGVCEASGQQGEGRDASRSGNGRA